MNSSMSLWIMMDYMGFEHWLMVSTYPSEKYEVVNWDDDYSQLNEKLKDVPVTTKEFQSVGERNYDWLVGSPSHIFWSLGLDTLNARTAEQLDGAALDLHGGVPFFALIPTTLFISASHCS